MKPLDKFLLFTLISIIIIQCNVVESEPDLNGTWTIYHSNQSDIISIQTSDKSINFDGAKFNGEFSNDNRSFKGTKKIDQSSIEKLNLSMSSDDRINGSVQILYLNKIVSTMSFNGIRNGH